MTTHVRPSAVKDPMQQARIDLAAAYRLIHRLGLDDSIYTHISARVPGPEHHFLINPYGYLFEEITASMLVKVDESDRKALEQDRRFYFPAYMGPFGWLGHRSHGASHRARACAL